MSRRPAEHPPGYKENEYSVVVGCVNCGISFTLFLKKGTLVHDVIKNKICKNCECRGTLKKTS